MKNLRKIMYILYMPIIIYFSTQFLFPETSFHSYPRRLH